MKLKHVFKLVLKGVVKYAPILCAGIGTACTSKGVVSAGKEVPRFHERIEKLVKSKGRELTFGERLSCRIKSCKKTIFYTATGLLSFIGGIFFSQKKLAASTVLVAAAAEKLADYKEAVAEVAKEGFENVTAETFNKKVETKVVEKETVRETKKAEAKRASKKTSFQPKAGQELYKLADIGKEFYATKNDIYGALNEINEELLTDGQCLLNEFLTGLDEDEIRSTLGWDFTKSGLVRIRETYGPASTGGACTIIKFEPSPYTI